MSTVSFQYNVKRLVEKKEQVPATQKELEKQLYHYLEITNVKLIALNDKRSFTLQIRINVEFTQWREHNTELNLN